MHKAPDSASHRVARTACALAACLAMGHGAAHAVHVNGDGFGQALIFPYYTARNGFATLLSVINTQDNTKALKVNFLEGRNAREVLTFNLFLAPNDTWTAAVVPTARGARLITNDNSCVTPSDLFTEVRTDALGLPLNEFKNYQYSGSNVDIAQLQSLDRTREGYFEIIEMGVFEPIQAGNEGVAGFKVSALTANLRPRSTGFPRGVPPACAAADAYDPAVAAASGAANPDRFPNIGAQWFAPPRGGLVGRASLINSASGANLTFRPVALDGWSSRVAYSCAGCTGETALAMAYPAQSTSVTAGGMVQARWPDTPEGRRDAVSAALMRAALVNEYVLDDGTASQTDWVVTFPTRRFYFSYGRGPGIPPFARDGCEEFDAQALNREGAMRPVTPQPIGVPPPVPPGSVPASVFCSAANVLPFGIAARGSLTGSLNLAQLKNYDARESGPTIAAWINASTTTPGNRTTPSLRSVQGPNGQFIAAFKLADQALTPSSAKLIHSDATIATVTGKHLGLPAVGIMLHNYQNAGVTSRYGGVMEHKYRVVTE